MACFKVAVFYNGSAFFAPPYDPAGATNTHCTGGFAINFLDNFKPILLCSTRFFCHHAHMKTEIRKETTFDK